jgi:type VI secretion system protein ImpA
MENDHWTLQFARLIEPLSVEKPCGENLEDTHALAAFDTYRIFGQLIVYRDEPDWRALHTLALTTLEKTKDFRVLAHLLAATLRTHSLSEGLRLIPVMSAWLEKFWTEIYPRPADDAILCANVLTAFADRVAIVDPLKRLPLIRHAQLGSFCIRDYEGADEGRASEIQAIATSADAREIASLNDLAAAARQALRDTESLMRERAGMGAVPLLDPLANAVGRIQQVLSPHVARAAPTTDESTTVAAAIDAGSPAAARKLEPGSRQAALDALELATQYFSAHEPTSPVSLLLRRARRIATMSFLQMIAEIAPEALDHAARVTGRVDEFSQQ